MLNFRELDDLLFEVREKYVFNMLLHAPEDEGKTEDATETRKRKARDEEGRVFLTQELPQAMALMLGVSAIYMLSDFYIDNFYQLFQKYYVDLLDLDININNISVLVEDTVFFLLKLFLPVGILMLMTSFVFYAIQTNFFFSTVTLKLDFKRIAFSWNNFLKKTIFTRHQIIMTIKIVIKIVFISIFAYFYLKAEFLKLEGILHQSLVESVKEVGFSIYKIFLIVGFFLFILSLPDWYVQKMEYEKSLKMTKEEVKKEYKELEGDPLIKSKIRQRARELATSDMINSVKEADVLITNPTHFSCAIKYAFQEMDAPKLIGKGQDNVALKMREIAKEYNVPIVENKPLARGMYANVEVNQFVPMEYYSAIAEILAALEKYKVQV